MNRIKNYFIDKYYNKVFKPYIEEYGIDSLRKRLYDGITPYGYGSAKYRIDSALKGFNAKKSPLRDDIWAEYLQIPKDQRHLIFGKYNVYDSFFKPSNSKENINYKRIGLTKDDKVELVNDYYRKDRIKPKDKLTNVLGKFFGTHVIDSGFDKKGQYVSYYDKWDLSPSDDIININKGNRGDESRGIGKPIEFYDRIYLDDVYNIPEKAKGNPWITPAVITAKRKKINNSIWLKKLK